MKEPQQLSPAEALADSILRAAGSGLRNYTMPSTRAAIIAAAQDGIDARYHTITALRAQLAKAQSERDAAITALFEAARKRGEAEGKLAASEMAGVVDGWRDRALNAEAQLATARELIALLEEDQARRDACQSPETLARVLKPCPLCGCELTLEGRFWIHPGDDCFLSQIVLPPEWVESWNTRAAPARVEGGRE